MEKTSKRKRSRGAFNDFVAGAVSGAVSKYVEQPFDTIKVLQQTQSKSYANWIDCLRKTVHKGGIASLYKGVTCPLIGSIAECAVTFLSYDYFKELFAFTNKGRYGEIKQLILAAGCSGVCIACVQTPAELLKCKIQVLQGIHVDSSFKQYNGAWDAMVQILKEEGIRGMFRGNLSTIYREIPGDIGWFGAYELVTGLIAKYKGGRQYLNVLDISLAGAIAGIAYWTAFYPADTVKSNIQTDLTYKNLSFKNAIIRIFKEQGFKGLYNGWVITVIKAIPTNASLFVSYHYTFKLLEQYNNK